MSLDKAIAHGKEYRKQYTTIGKRVSKGCRNHSSCNRCREDRLYRYKKALAAAKERERE